MPAWALPLIQIGVGALAPILTALLEALARQLGLDTNHPTANAVKAPANAALGGLLATGLVGGDPQVALVAGAVGAQIGNRIRESLNKSAKKT